MKKLLAVTAMLVAMFACSDVFETNISGKRVAVVAPADKTEIVEGLVSFRWSALEGADKYRVTIISPDFDYVHRAVRDTVLYRDSLAMSYGFEIELTPADYQWSIQAFNAAYESVKTIYGLSVVPPPDPPKPVYPDISRDRISIVAPVDKTEITEGRVSFRWDALDGADGYRATIVSPDFEHARLAVKDTLLYHNSSLAMSFGFELSLAPADYQWSIQAFNTECKSIRSVYDLTVEPKDPIVPEPPDIDISDKTISIVAPVNKTEIPEGRVSFRWDALDGTDKYRVTIVSPDFEHARQAVKDTVIYRDSLSMTYGFEMELTPAKYQWSIQAFNDTYESIKSVYDLTVEPKL